MQTEKGTQSKSIFLILEKFRDLLERASQSASPAHNRKWEGEFHKMIMGPTVTMLLTKATRLEEELSVYLSNIEVAIQEPGRTQLYSPQMVLDFCQFIIFDRKG